MADTIDNSANEENRWSQSTSAVASFSSFAEINKGALQMRLVALIEGQNWVRLDHSLMVPFFSELARSLHENASLFGATILHIVLRNGPPVEIVEGILRKFPEMVFLPDSVGRYPLHIASSAGVSSKIIRILADAYPLACTTQDSDGRTPLHFACDRWRALYEEGKYHPYQGRVSINTIVCLVSIAPSAVLLEDVYQMNAIELAILSDVSKEVISLLQGVRDRKRCGKRWRSDPGPRKVPVGNLFCKGSTWEEGRAGNSPRPEDEDPLDSIQWAAAREEGVLGRREKGG